MTTFSMDFQLIIPPVARLQNLRADRTGLLRLQIPDPEVSSAIRHFMNMRRYGRTA